MPDGVSGRARLVHVTDLHNRPGAFRLVRRLCRDLRPDLVVNTGDISGIGGPFEAVLLRVLGRVPCPVVFVPGNHDSEVTCRQMRRLGAEVLSEPGMACIGGVRVWGYWSPERAVPPDGEPFIIAVHIEAMVDPIPAQVPLLLCGHRHDPEVRQVGSTLVVRPGAAGGTSPWSGPIRAAVVDIALPSHQPLGVWLVEATGHAPRFDPISPGSRPAG